MKCNKELNQLYSPLSLLPGNVAEEVTRRLNDIIHYQPVIGIMGKTGAGKSSLCNALFRSYVSPVSHTTACTREPQRFTLQAGERPVTIIDLPGVGESPERDEEYRALYQRLWPELDLVLWLIKADDRALTPDCDFYGTLPQGESGQGKVMFVLTQADKTEPAREWSGFLNQPSDIQRKHIQEKECAVSTLFKGLPHPVISVSAATGWQLPELVTAMFHALPARASSAVSTALKPQFRTRQIKEQARQDFGDAVDDVLTQTLSEVCLPAAVTAVVNTVINTVVSVARSLWRFLF
jgi:hypothetical protein